jgi:enterobactin synthetase component D
MTRLPFLQMYLQVTNPFQKASISYCAVERLNHAYDDTLYRSWGIEMPASINRAVQSRRAEFLLGRICAREAVRSIDPYFNGPIDLQNDRSPRWPSGTLGSITHCTHVAAAAVCATTVASGIGLDVICRLTPALAKELAPVILHPEEFAYEYVYCETKFSWFVGLVFSIKESLFKALYPSSKTYFDFKDARLVSLDENKQKYSLRLERSLNNIWGEGSVFQGEYLESKGHLLTLILV